MIMCRLYIPLYDWNVTAFFDACADDVGVIIDELQYIGCPVQTMVRVENNLTRDRLDTGFTYSNKMLRESVMTVGRASSPAEFLNSYTHELRHLVDDIAVTSFLPMRGEAVGYLTGELSWEFWNEIHDFLCCRCHRE
jgi:hypothetical protein